MSREKKTSSSDMCGASTIKTTMEANQQDDLVKVMSDMRSIQVHYETIRCIQGLEEKKGCRKLQGQI